MGGDNAGMEGAAADAGVAGGAVADAGVAGEAAARETRESGEAVEIPVAPPDQDRTTPAENAGGASASPPQDPLPAGGSSSGSAPLRSDALGGGAVATEGASTVPQPAAAAATGVLVIVYGDDSGGARQVESAVLRSLLGRSGLQALDASALSMIRGDQQAVEAANAGSFSSLAALGRQHGAEFLVVGDLTTRAQPSVGQFFAGTAEMDMKMYRVSSGDLVDANTFRIEPGETELALSEGEARSRAAQAAGSEAAQAARVWLNRAMR